MSSPSAPPSFDPTDGGLASRRAALEILQAIVLRHQSFDTQFGTRCRHLSPQDRAFVQKLVMTGLRQYAALKARSLAFLEKPFPPKFAAAEWLLLLGCIQLEAGVPPHAAVNTSLQLAEELRLQPVKGVLNAILRRLLREGPPLTPACNLPDWWRERWEQHYGTDTTRAILQACSEPPTLDLTLRSPDATPLPEGERLSPINLRLTDAANPDQLPGYAEGQWWVQDIAATLPARLLGDLNHKQVIDVCAAPGGKTAQLIAAGATVTAIDRSAKRLERLKSNLQRLQMQATVIATDALNWEPEAPADAILLDAPCTATGTLRRHPDMPFLRNQGDLTELTALQSALLDRCWQWLKPGGTLVYATCSLEPEEGEDQLQAFLKRTSDAAIRPITAEELPAFAASSLTHGGWLRCLPTDFAEGGGMDGFFIARLVKS